MLVNGVVLYIDVTSRTLNKKLDQTNTKATIINSENCVIFDTHSTTSLLLSNQQVDCARQFVNVDKRLPVALLALDYLVHKSRRRC